MKKEILVCDECGNEIANDRSSKYINLPTGDLDSHGIWFGHIGEYLWFHDEKFCSLGCFLKFVENWYKRAEHSAHSDAGKSADLEAESNADNLSTSQAVA